MSGVYFQLGKDSITFVATDAHKMVRYRRSDLSTDNEGSFIVPKKPLNLLKNILGDGEQDVKVSYNDKNAFFELGNYSLICRLIDGRYPNYEAVIPVDNPNKLTISRSALLNSVRRVSIYSNKTTHQVRLKITGSELQISAEDLDFANEANERLSCQFDGEDMEIGFNARYLLDITSQIEGKEVRFLLSDAGSPAIIEDAEDGRTLYVLMPLRV
jgi:DNA polymerase-3 subunit beta